MPQLPPPTTLDGNPPAAPGMGPQQQPTIQQLTPGAQFGGGMQVVQMSLQAAAEAAKLIDLLGQINPAFAPTASMLIEQLKGGLRSSLQQGMQGSEPSIGMLGGGPGAAAPAGPAQAGPPMLPPGIQ